ncbi:unnamed protein product [Allacma fusca]|uniref:Uncharacterized protein n=1 Tax=Allacma fusca TaxID=39272 RepID=A0A8J2K3E0_9HEXA|nr:unnamed protein product [Allacma fusca]
MVGARGETNKRALTTRYTEINSAKRCRRRRIASSVSALLSTVRSQSEPPKSEKEIKRINPESTSAVGSYSECVQETICEDNYLESSFNDNLYSSDSDSDANDGDISLKKSLAEWSCRRVYGWAVLHTLKLIANFELTTASEIKARRIITVEPLL